MGAGRWDPDAWKSFSSSVASTPRAAVFRSTGIDPAMDPKDFKFRESVDSDKNPKSTPIMIGVDETGSMGELAEIIIKKGLGVIVQEILDRKPISDPHILLMALGDATCDRAPIQMTQFEADNCLIDQLAKFFIEANGGGNRGESYPLAWYAAAHRTKCDAITKRKRKGYLFTIGDECPLPSLTKDQIKKFFGDDIQSDIKIEDLLDLVSRNWEVFHLIVRPVGNQPVVSRWRELLGQRAIQVDDTEKLAEVIVSTIQVIEGENPEDVAVSWTGDTAIVVRNAIKDLKKGAGTDAEVVRL